jgi:hypothetical protein
MDQRFVPSSKPARSGWKGTGVDFKTWQVLHLKVAPKKSLFFGWANWLIMLALGVRRTPLPRNYFLLCWSIFDAVE